MIARPLKVLLIEDNPADANLIKDFLDAAPDDAIDLEMVDRLAVGLKRLIRGDIEGVLLDLGLPDSQGLATLARVKTQAPQMPIVVLSGLDDHALAEAAVREGAQDYLVKGTVNGKEIVRALRYAIERKAVEEALRLSEQRYKKLLTSVTDYLYSVQVEKGQPIATLHGVGCAAVTGYTPQDFADDAYLWYRMIHEDDRQAVLQQTAKVLSGEEPPSLEHRIIHKDGTPRWIRNTIVVRHDKRGQVISYDGLISDITERRRSHEALKDSEELYHSLVETIPLHMFRKDLKGRFTFANKLFCDALGNSLVHIIGKTDHDFFPRELADKYCGDDLKVLTTGEAFEDTERHQLPNGEPRYVTVMKTPVYDANKRIIGTQGIFWDVTTSKWAEEQKAQLRVARTIQQKLLPRVAPQVPGFELGGASYPAEACSGDYFDYIKLDGAVDIVVGDVSGHGFGPALLAAVTHSCLRTLALARMGIDIEVILSTANRLLLEDTGSEHFVTLIFARLNVASRSLVYSNAGHPAGFLLDGEGRLKARLGETGPLLGVFSNETFLVAPPVALQPGDLVIFVSDGVLEAMPENGRKFGTERALATVLAHREENAQAIAEALCQATLTHYGHANQRDDVTVVVIKALP